MADMQEMLGAMGAGEGIETNVDIVFVIDATRSMQTTIDMVKESALSFHEKLSDCLKNAGRVVKNLRIKVIWFRDFYYDGRYAYGESKFFELPDEQDAFRDFVSEIREAGGGDDPESGLEALTLALRSDFVQEGEKKRHIIVLFTDAEAHAFEDYDRLVAEAAERGCRPEIYPDNMPKSLAEFYNAWQGNEAEEGTISSDGRETKLDPTGRRMVLFAPNAYPWSDMEIELEYTIRKPIEAGEGGAELDMSEVYSMIAFSM
jgi:hypothetical protein